MIGRAALGNPWILKEISEYLETGVISPKIEPAEKFAMCLKHMELLIANKGTRVGMREMRSHAA